MTWTMMTGTFGDVRDTYIETLCNAGRGYVFNGVCTPFEMRVDVIKVKGAASVNFPILRTIHGPVIQGTDLSRPGVCTAPCFSQKRVSWKREIESEKAFLAINRARNLQEFEAAVRRLEISHNILYADKAGNIAYWLSGKIAVRPAEFDARLPFPGTGEAEWTGEFRPVPFSINPTRGWLTNWNSKPEAGYPNPDQRSFGKQYRSLEIDQRLEHGLISLQDMKQIAEDIARTEQGGDGRDSRYLKPYLLRALDEVPPTNPLATQARSVLENWDGSLFADAKSSTTLEPGQVIFDRWLNLMLSKTFGDELGIELSQATSNMLIHVLDDALGGGSGAPPSSDYFNGSAPNQVISAAFDEALAALGTNPQNWSTQPRGVVRFRHTLYPAIPEVATMLDSNRGTYAMAIVLSHPHPTSESILSLGASGFIGRDPSNNPEFDAHFSDQLSLFREFMYKPMRLYRNTQLQE
jgi:penicillin amidase